MSKTKIIFIVALFLVLILTGALYWFYYRPRFGNQLPLNQQNQTSPGQDLETTPSGPSGFFWLFTLDIRDFDLGEVNTLLNEEGTNYDFIIYPPTAEISAPQKAVYDLTSLTDQARQEYITNSPDSTEPLMIRLDQYNSLKQADFDLANRSLIIDLRGNSYFDITDSQAWLKYKNEKNFSFMVNNQLSDPDRIPQRALDTFTIYSEEQISCHDNLKDCLKDEKVEQDLKKIAQNYEKYMTPYFLSFGSSKEPDKYRTYWFSQLPQVTQVSVAKEQVPIINWQVNYPNKYYKQEAFSYYVSSKNNNATKALYKSGKVSSNITAIDYIPITDPKNSDFSFDLTLWSKFNGYSLPLNLENQIDFQFDFSIPDLSQAQSSKTWQAGWIPDWGFSDGLKSIKQDVQSWDEVNPVWFVPDKKGQLERQAHFNDSQLVNLCKQHKIKLVPTIALFDPDILNSILNRNLDNHVNTIISTVKKNNYDGIDLDYESTYLKDKELLLEFITKLAKKLHKDKKTLSFTAVSKWSDQEIYSFLPQTHQAQDWQVIGQEVDQLRIMAYDFTAQGSSRPGPLSPIIWDEIILKYALDKVPAEKVVLALPLYSHSWAAHPDSLIPGSSHDPTGSNNDKPLYSLKKQTYSYTHKQIGDLKTLSSYKENWDSWNHEIKGSYTSQGQTRTMFYLDKKAVDDRKKLANLYKIKGLAYWRIGEENIN